MTKKKEATNETAKLALWEGGAVRSENVGPARGGHHLGDVTGPGLYMLVAPNAGGKTHHLELLAKLGDESLLRREVSVVSDGEASAFLEVGAARVTFRVGSDGRPRAPRVEGADRLPRIERLPLPVETLITGDNLKGEDARARRRLEALLSYSPVDATDERLRGLARALERKPFAAPVDPALVAAWRELGEEAAAKTGKARRFSPAPLRSDGELLEELLVDADESDILAAHAWLVERLNALGLTGEKIVDEQRERVAAVAARVDAALESAAARTALTLASVRDRIHALEGSGLDVEAAAEVHEQAGQRASELAFEARRRREEEARRERLRESHGERPKIDAAAAAVTRCRAAAESAANRLGALLDRERAVRAVLDERAPDGERLSAEFSGARDRAAAAWRKFEVAGDSPAPGGPDLAAAADALAERIERVLETHSRLREHAATHGAEEKVLAELREDVPLARAAVAEVDEALELAEEELARQREALDRWEDVEALLDAPVPGPSDEEVEAERALAAEAGRARVLAEHAAAYRGAVEAHAVAVELLDRLDEVAGGYREAARDSWVTLGDVVTEALELAWLRVDGTRIKLLYDRRSGRLLGESPGSGEGPDEGEHVEVRDLDDDARISTAELHEAMLRLMLARRERLGGILILPWQVTAALDDDRLRRLAGAVRDAGLVVFSERPRRAGDSDDLHLENVEPLEEAASS